MSSSIPHVLRVHGQGLANLKYNQYIGVLSTQATEHPSCGTKFGENCKDTKPSSGLSMLSNEKPQAMYVLPSILNVLWVHRKV